MESNFLNHLKIRRFKKPYFCKIIRWSYSYPGLYHVWSALKAKFGELYGRFCNDHEKGHWLESSDYFNIRIELLSHKFDYLLLGCQNNTCPEKVNLIASILSCSNFCVIRRV
jgi:hypothetical protein